LEIPQIDRSGYLKGLLITARKDNQLSGAEKSIIKELAIRLGFSSDFFEEVIANLLGNKYITEEPIKFSNQDIAKSFIEDALKLSLSDKIITENEIDWLKETVKVNGIREIWFNKKLNDFKNKPHLMRKVEFALYSLI
jgi:hypothetical protein